MARQFEARFTPEQREQSGLVMKRQESSGFFDRFRGRLMFPIHNESGKVIGFGGRALRSGDEPKYLNSPETPLYRKSYVLYNLHRAKDAIRKSDYAVLVEGYMDVIGVYSAGVRNVVASCGTALTNTQVRALKRHSGRIVVNFDPDAAGANAAERSIQMLLDEGFQVRVLELEGDLDPDEYVKQHGAETYRARLEKAPSYFHWLADRARKKFDMRTVEGRMQGFKFVAPAIQRIADRLERFAVANDVANYLGVDEKLVRDHFSQGSARAAHGAAGSRGSAQRAAAAQFAACERGGARRSDPSIARNAGGGPLRHQARFSGHFRDARRRESLSLYGPGRAPGRRGPGSIVRRHFRR